MGEDRRQSDRRVGPADRRIDSSSVQFQDRRSSNISNSDNEKTHIILTAFIITIIVILIVATGMIWFVYNNLNNKITELNSVDDVDYYDEDYIIEEDLDADENLDIIEPDLESTDEDLSNTVETTNDEDSSNALVTTTNQ